MRSVIPLCFSILLLLEVVPECLAIDWSWEEVHPQWKVCRQDSFITGTRYVVRILNEPNPRFLLPQRYYPENRGLHMVRATRDDKGIKWIREIIPIIEEPQTEYEYFWGKENYLFQTLLLTDSIPEIHTYSFDLLDEKAQWETIDSLTLSLEHLAPDLIKRILLEDVNQDGLFDIILLVRRPNSHYGVDILLREGEGWLRKMCPDFPFNEDFSGQYPSGIGMVDFEHDGLREILVTFGFRSTQVKHYETDIYCVSDLTFNPIVHKVIWADHVESIAYFASIPADSGSKLEYYARDSNTFSEWNLYRDEENSYVIERIRSFTFPGRLSAIYHSNGLLPDSFMTYTINYSRYDSKYYDYYNHIYTWKISPDSIGYTKLKYIGTIPDLFPVYMNFVGIDELGRELYEVQGYYSMAGIYSFEFRRLWYKELIYLSSEDNIELSYGQFIPGGKFEGVGYLAGRGTAVYEWNDSGWDSVRTFDCLEQDGCKFILDCDGDGLLDILSYGPVYLTRILPSGEYIFEKVKPFVDIEDFNRIEDILWTDWDNDSDIDIYDYRTNSIYVNQVTGTPKQTNPFPQQFSLVSLYPNPFNSTLTFEYVSTLPLTYSIYNIIGQQVASPITLPQLLTPKGVSIPFESQPSGVYFLRLEANGESHEQKIILQK
ncbi:T9SS type A sorting domain-containing protein [bacterium]|nr:T9SS type A sorting domain-containing protein [bacterium]